MKAVADAQFCGEHVVHAPHSWDLDAGSRGLRCGGFLPVPPEGSGTWRCKNHQAHGQVGDDSLARHVGDVLPGQPHLWAWGWYTDYGMEWAADRKALAQLTGTGCQGCGNDTPSEHGGGYCLDCLEAGEDHGELDDGAHSAVLIVRDPSRDDLRAVAEVGRQMAGRGLFVAVPRD